MEMPEAVVEDATPTASSRWPVEAIERMLDEGRECRDVVTQISAATKAPEQVGFRIVAAGFTYCVQHPDDAAAEGYPLEEIQKMFMKLA